ncbi:uncharacterized protein LOC120358543 isoform X2 [Solenopsis invicta]|uniref:uncharacterized protein LOC120358543 isoform X2 n=1 Tax=Solenopsis invicta TaxID=13686 RepID=UPI00193CBCBD|nr:uncharacterized protein LOC120358543 isoform X2 [Solenopsis invicta]
MSGLKKTVFRDEWTLKPEFIGIQKGKVKTEAYCTICKKVLQLSNMGIMSLKSHVKSGTKHNKLMLDVKKSANMHFFTTAKDSCSSTLHVDTDNSVLKQKTNEQSVPTHSETQFISGLAGTASHSETTSLANSCIDKYFFKDDVTRVEILWCLQTVENHASISSAGKQSSLFPLMFPDSRIASSLCLARRKLSYGIVSGALF